jgi:hypothetical protein
MIFTIPRLCKPQTKQKYKGSYWAPLGNPSANIVQVEVLGPGAAGPDSGGGGVLMGMDCRCHCFHPEIPIVCFVLAKMQFLGTYAVSGDFVFSGVLGSWGLRKCVFSDGTSVTTLLGGPGIYIYICSCKHVRTYACYTV